MGSEGPPSAPMREAALGGAGVGDQSEDGDSPPVGCCCTPVGSPLLAADAPALRQSSPETRFGQNVENLRGQLNMLSLSFTCVHSNRLST